MENEKFVGKGWSNQYQGIRVSIKLDDIKNLPVNKYGDVELYVGPRKQVDEKSKATHYVKWSLPKQTTDALNTLEKHGYKAEPNPFD